MGACFLAVELPGNLTKDEVKRKLRNLREQALDTFQDDFEGDEEDFEDEAEYSGSWNTIEGITFLNQTFNSVREADDWLDKNTTKRGPAKVVRAKKDMQEVWYLGGMAAS